MSKFARDWWKIALVLLVVIVLFRVPATVRIIWYLLPLGSGVDDLVEIVAVAALLIVLIVKGWISIPEWFKRK